MKQEIPLPMAVVRLVNSNNELLRMYQRTLTEQVLDAAYDSMKLIGLNPTDGWRVDLEKMVYVKEEDQSAAPVGE